MQSNDNTFTENMMPSGGVSNTLHNVQTVDIYKEAAQTRVLPRQLSAGAQRGEMVIFGKLTIGDPNSDQRIIIGTNGDDFGMFAAEVTNGDDVSVALSIGSSAINMYKLDDSGRNTLRLGLLPDGSYNMVATKDGYGVEDAY